MQESLFNVNKLPPHFQARTAELDAVRSLVLKGKQSMVAVTGKTHRTGVQGKSVLVAAQARYELIREEFSDGVIWITVG